MSRYSEFVYGTSGPSDPDAFPPVKTKADLNGHLVNDHEYTDGGAGNSARNMPSKAELQDQHEMLHKHYAGTGHSRHDHVHED